MTIQDAIETQSLQLKKYKAMLNEEAFSALQEYCTTENTKVLDDPEGDSSDIPYGGQLDHFLTDWADSQITEVCYIPRTYPLEFLVSIPDLIGKLNGGKILGVIVTHDGFCVVAELTRSQKHACEYTVMDQAGFETFYKPEWM